MSMKLACLLVLLCLIGINDAQTQGGTPPSGGGGAPGGVPPTGGETGGAGGQQQGGQPPQQGGQQQQQGGAQQGNTQGGTAQGGSTQIGAGGSMQGGSTQQQASGTLQGGSTQQQQQQGGSTMTSGGSMQQGSGTSAMGSAGGSTTTTSSSTTTISCNAGYFSKNNVVCIKCHYGYYKALAGTQSCTKCADKTTTNEEGATSSASCTVQLQSLKSKSVSLALKMDISLYNADKTGFTSQLVSDISTALAVTADRVSIDSVEAGSVRVVTTIYDPPPSRSSETSASDLANSLQEMASNPSSPLFLGTLTKNVDAEENGPPHSVDKNTIIIAAVVAGGVVAAALIGLIAVVLFRKKKVENVRVSAATDRDIENNYDNNNYDNNNSAQNTNNSDEQWNSSASAPSYHPNEIPMKSFQSQATMVYNHTS